MSNEKNTTEEQKKSVLLNLSAEELEAVEAYRFDNRIPTRTAALRQLIQCGLRYSKTAKEAANAAALEKA